MIIEHEKYGRVDGVEVHEEAMDAGWFKQDKPEGGVTFYFRHFGWREVKEPAVVDVTGQCYIKEPDNYTGGDGRPTNFLYFPVHQSGGTGIAHNYRWRLVERYELPDDWKAQYLEYWNKNGDRAYVDVLEKFINQFRKPSLIIEQVKP